MTKLFALVDCNNFYVSCERLFNPRLEKRPVAVLSNNDGCIVARSNEVKALGVPMGAPLFKWARMLEKNRVALYSSNYTLYADISSRVFRELRRFCADVQIYSIDEAFLVFDTDATLNSDARSDKCHPVLDTGSHTNGRDSGSKPGMTFEEKLGMTGKGAEQIEQYLRFVQAQITKSVGIPLSIGLGPTKTLAKAANHWAKRYEQYGGVYSVCAPDVRRNVLSHLPVGNIWGVGRRYARMLDRYGIVSAAELISYDDTWIKKHMTIVGLKTVWELRGRPCISLGDGTTTRKSIIRSRSFREPLTTLCQLKRAVSLYASRVGEKLRADDVACFQMTVFIRTSKYVAGSFYSNSATGRLPIATSCTPTLIAMAKRLLTSIYKDNQQYKRAGIMVTDLVTHGEQQLVIGQPLTSIDPACDRQMESIDALNARWGSSTIVYGAALHHSFYGKQILTKSARFTTEWDELLTINLD